MRISTTESPVRPLAPPQEPPPLRPSAPVDEPASFASVLHGLGRDLGDGERSMRIALTSMRAGRDLGTTELIALQAGVYRYSVAVDLASRLVDRVTGSVKTIIQGGGQ